MKIGYARVSKTETRIADGCFDGSRCRTDLYGQDLGSKDQRDGLEKLLARSICSEAVQMNRIFSEVLNLFLNRTVLWIQVTHWSIFALGIYQRGGIADLFSHATYEPVALLFLMVLDLPAIYLVDCISSIYPIHGSHWMTFLVSVGCIALQWFIFGAVIYRVFFKTRQASLA
jgi:hypothetical protein